MRKSLLWYIRLFSMLSLCVLLFFLLQLFAYQRFSDQLREEFVQRQQVYLTRGASLIENEYTAYYATQIPAIQRIEWLQKLHLSADLQQYDFAHMIKTRSELVDILGKRGEEKPFLLVLINGDSLAMSTDAIYHNLSQSFASGNLYFDGMSFDDFSSFLYANASLGALTSHANVVSFSRGQGEAAARLAKPYLCVIRRVSAAPSRNDAYALWLYSLDTLHKMISNGSETSSFFSLSFGDTILYTSDLDIGPRPFSGMSMYDPGTRSTYFRVPIFSLGLTACLSLSDDVVLSSLQSFCSLRNALLLSFCALSAILLLLVLFYLVKPLNRLYKRTLHSAEPAPNASGNVISQLERHIDQLGNDRLQMELTVNRWSSLLHKNVLIKLLRGEPLSPSSAEILSGMSYATSEQAFRVVLIGCRGAGMQAFAQARTAFNAHIDETQIPLCVWINEAHAVLILPDGYPPHISAADDREEALRAYLATLYEALLHRLRLPETLTFAVGLEHTDIRNVHLSYLEAKSAYYDAEAWHRSGVVFYELGSSGQSLYNVSYDDLMRLQNMLATGATSEACAQLDELAARILSASSARTPEEGVLRQFFSEIRGVVLRISIQHHEPSILKAFPPFEEFLSLRAWLLQVHAAFQYIGQVLQSLQSGGATLSDELISYISKYYADSAMSLSTLAEAFSMSERSLSRYFKDKMQDTFTNVLEKYRLGEAEKLLIAGNATLRDIAEQVGYANASTFLKAFKRRYGITPSEWAQQIRRYQQTDPSACS